MGRKRLDVQAWVHRSTYRSIYLRVPLRHWLIPVAFAALAWCWIPAFAVPLSGQQEGRAEDESWWAYRPLERPAIPVDEAPSSAVHPVDAHVEALRGGAGLSAAPEADPLTLLRRASFALTGLPPSAEVRERFRTDVEARGVDAAWGMLLEELQASPQYGVHSARAWLDLVRYAETNGYERDSPKEGIWRYRDWVVDALNDDVPYDRFVQLQMAGDEYAESMGDRGEATGAKLATGVYRLGVWDDEPSDRPQALSDERADIVDTFSQLVFATTMGCARCHDHKADPVSQNDYFALTAHFRGVEGYRYGGTRPLAAAGPSGVWTTSERDEAVALLDAEIKGLVSRADQRKGPQSIVLVADARAAETQWRYSRTAPVDGWATPGFDASDWSVGAGGFGRKNTPGGLVRTPWKTPDILLRTEFWLESVPETLRLRLHHDEDVKVFLNGALVLERGGYQVSYEDYQLGAEGLRALVVGRNVLAVQCHQTAGGQYIDVGLDTALDLSKPEGLVAAAETLVTGDGPEVERLQALLGTRKRYLSGPVVEPFPAQLAYERGAKPASQHVELRGSAHALGDIVEPSLPAAWRSGARAGAAAYSIPAAPKGAASSGRRMALSEWAFDGGAHLTARVQANRVWQRLFGRGLCRTPGDFGRLGERPTHPELLDELAWQLIDREWSVKSLEWWIMESGTYRMASAGDPASEPIDPRNNLYWRFDPHRLTAEEFRDAALAVSGELDDSLGGPWVFPPLAPEVLATSSRPDAAWGRAEGTDAVRRSLYVHVKRSLREPLLAALDQPDPDLPCPSRFPTNVPTQALLTLNGTFAQSAAQSLATSVGEANGAPLKPDADPVGEAWCVAAIETALGREPKEGEASRGAEFLRAVIVDHEETLESARRLFALGLLNRNEFMWVD